MSYVTYATCDLPILQNSGLTSRIPLHCNYRTEITSKNGLLHTTVKYISRHKKSALYLKMAVLERKLKPLYLAAGRRKFAWQFVVMQLHETR